jgi:hypothetical protein
MNLREIVLVDVDWILLAQGRDRWRSLVGNVMKLKFSVEDEKFRD